MRDCLTFSGGVHPLHSIGEGKIFTQELPVEVMNPPEIVKIPLSQHIGAPAKEIVQVGDYVKKGQKIGEANGFVSVSVHASVSGEVIEITNILGLSGKPIRAIVIKNDFKEEEAYGEKYDYKSLDKDKIVDIIKDAGIVGMGGATFPTHVKISPPPDKKIDTLIINGAECEPFLTADHRLMLEKPEKIVLGIQAIMKVLRVSQAFIGIENNKPDAIEVMRKAIPDKSILVAEIMTKYPQGSEKQLIDALTGRVVPSGALPMDVGVVVSNVASAAAIADALLLGKPLIERIVTVSGAVKTPANLLVRIGTSTQAVIDYLNGFDGEPRKLISGGPMMGLPIPSLECVVTKGSSGILVLDDKYTKKEVEGNCIKCGKCADVCPIKLSPFLISASAEFEDFEKADSYFAIDCMSCGSCSYTCPAKKPIAQNIKFAKDMILLNRIKEKQKKESE